MLSYGNGRLTTAYTDEFDDPDNSERQKIAQLARDSATVIRTDVSDEVLTW